MREAFPDFSGRLPQALRRQVGSHSAKQKIVEIGPATW
jgi:hypothetical protein